VVDWQRGVAGMCVTSFFRVGEQSAYIQGLLFYNANYEIKVPQKHV
jgi:hypothetical protein